MRSTTLSSWPISSDHEPLGRVTGETAVPAPLVSVIVPSLDGRRDGNLERLLADVAGQSLRDVEVLVVTGIRPNGRARNVGAAGARGSYLVFVDDDVRLGHRDVLANLVSALEADPSLGLVGPSQLVPPGATPFQRRAARHLRRSVFPVVDRVTDTDMVTHMCLAIPAGQWRQIGGEHDDLVRGTDPDLRERVRRAGHRVAVVPHTWAYHPPPEGLRELVGSSYRGGRAAAWVRRYHPGLAYDVPEGDFAGRAAVRGRAYRIGRFVLRIPLAVARGRWLLAAADAAYAAGYASFYLARPEPTIEELA